MTPREAWNAVRSQVRCTSERFVEIARSPIYGHPIYRFAPCDECDACRALVVLDEKLGGGA